MLVLLLLMVSSVPGDVILVDDDGVAPFTSIQAAVDVADPGDILLVEPGTYAGFVLDKELSILGRESGAPVLVTDPVRIAQAPSFELAGLDMPALRVHDVAGASILDDCRIGVVPLPPPDFQTLQIRDCDQLLVSRCTVKGRFGNEGLPVGSGGDGGTAVRTDRSTVVFVGCSLEGGWGGDNDGGGGNGGAALDVREGSFVQVSGCPLVRGGAEGSHSGLSSLTGLTGDGIFATASTVLVRGESSDFVVHGIAWFTPQPEGFSIHATESSLVIVSGVALGSSFQVELDALSAVLQPPEPEPFVEFTGGVQPGSTAALQVSGPAGQPALVLISLTAGSTSLPGVDGNIWPRVPDLLVALTTGGAGPPVTLTSSLPTGPGLEAVSVWVQTVFPGLSGSIDPGKIFLGNPDAVLIRP